MIVAIFRLLGTPGADSELARFPFYQKGFPTFAADLWPGRLRDHGDPDLLELLRQFLLLGPSLRWSAETALASPYCSMPPLEVQFRAARATRGLLSVAQGQVDPLHAAVVAIRYVLAWRRGLGRGESYARVLH